MIRKTLELFPEKNFEFIIFTFIFGRISNLTESMEITYQNEALVIRCSKQLMSRSFEVTRGQKSRKTSNFIFLKRRQIIPQNKALERNDRIKESLSPSPLERSERSKESYQNTTSSEARLKGPWTKMMGQKTDWSKDRLTKIT